MIQAIKVVRLILTFFFFGVLLFTYAYFPLTIDVNIDGMGRIDRDYFFYATVGLYLVINLITYFFRYYSDRNEMPEKRRFWIHALAPVLYFSMSVLIGYLTVVNNSNDLDASDFNYLNYLSVFLVGGWVLSFLFVLIKKI